jgi:DNA-binding protein HU-beta
VCRTWRDFNALGDAAASIVRQLAGIARVPVRQGRPDQIQKEHDMNNNELADALAQSAGVTKADARKIVETVFAAIGDAAAQGDEISLNGFGKFKVKDSPEREGRNPATGEAMTIKASKKLAFTPAKAVKDKLNG